jgi:hypothetical protein
MFLKKVSAMTDGTVASHKVVANVSVSKYEVLKEKLSVFGIELNELNSNLIANKKYRSNNVPPYYELSLRLQSTAVAAVEELLASEKIEWKIFLKKDTGAKDITRQFRGIDYYLNSPEWEEVKKPKKQFFRGKEVVVR